MGTITRAFANNITTSGILKPGAVNNDSFDNVSSVPSGSVTIGDLKFISKSTASSSSSIQFTSGIDSTYKEYIFFFINCHPSSSTVSFQFNGSIDGGSNYNVAKTTTYVLSRHAEDGSSSELSYKTGLDLANATGNQILSVDQINDNDSSVCGFLHLFNPSDTTFVKHFISRTQQMQVDDSMENYVAGYFNTTSAINAVSFAYSTGNIDAGEILLFGVN